LSLFSEASPPTRDLVSQLWTWNFCKDSTTPRFGITFFEVQNL
jgi:hypothetical protein